MRRALPLLVSVASVASLAAACGASPPVTRPAPRIHAPAVTVAPARWLLTDRLGVVFDEAGEGASTPRPEPAIVDGVRLLVDSGVIVASARHADRLLGFRSLPARLGGGFVMWSDDRVYRAAAFLEEPRPIADLGVAGGARAWLSSVLLRTHGGLFELDPTSLAIHRVAWPGVADALALDGMRGARLDVFGRAQVTVDGGKSFVDLLAARGMRVSTLREEGGEIALTGPTPGALRLGPKGDLHPPADPDAPRPDVRTATPLLGSALPPSSRALPGEIVAQAIARGAPLPGGRVLVTRENGARVLSLQTGLAVADTDLPAIDERFSRCQAASIGSPPAPSLVCSGSAGAEVIAIDGSLARLALDATFPKQAAGFIGGPHGRLAFAGRCGPAPPRAVDLGAGTPRPDDDLGSPPEPASPPTVDAPADPPADDDARVCVRTASARWIERRVRGDDARGLYRWVPGDDGEVTALVLAGRDDAPKVGAKKARAAEPSDPGAPAEGVRVIRIDANDPALRGAAFPALRAPEPEAPYRAIDVDFWQDDDGAIRGWIRLPDAGDEKEPASTKRARVTTDRGGRSAGVRIDAAGEITVSALPEGVAQVVTGGRFALATAPRDGGAAWFETTDGGARWTAIEGPPVGAIDPPDEHAIFACSSLGCAFGGVVRLGWGGPSPRKLPDLTLSPAASPRPRELRVPALRCRLDADAAPWAVARSPKPGKPASLAAPGVPIALGLAPSSFGALRDHTWTGEILPPFQPSAAPRRVSVRYLALSDRRGVVVPVLAGKPRDPVDLLLVLDDRRLRVKGPAALLPFVPGVRPVAGVELPGGVLALFDAGRAELYLTRGAAVSSVLHVTRPPDVSRLRLTLAARPSGGVALAGYSTSLGEVFAADVDVGRAEVGPPAALPRLDSLAVCGADEAAVRFVAELPIDVYVKGKGGGSLFDRQVTASVLVSASAARLCANAVEVALPEGHGTVLRATLGKAASASLWSFGKMARATCTLDAR